MANTTSFTLGITDTHNSVTAMTFATNTSAAADAAVSVIKPVTPVIVLWYFRLVFYGILGEMLAVVGTITNIINIVIFLKLGIKKDAMNVSLLGLAISDFVNCFPLLFLNLCLTPGFSDNKNLPFLPVTTYYLFAAWPHLTAVRISTCITAFITIERCLCVTYPLKIKQIFTPKRVMIVTVSIFLAIITLTAPMYHTGVMKWIFFPDRNRTVYTMVFREDRDEIRRPLFTIFGVIIPFSIFPATMISTFILVRNLKKNAKWRSSVTTTTTAKPKTDPTTPSSTTTNTTTTSSSKDGQIAPRDAKVAKMVSAISILYLVCYFPINIFTCAVILVPELKVGGAYENTLLLFYSVFYVLESTNACLNIFIYFTMSTNYKTMMKTIFSRRAVNVG